MQAAAAAGTPACAPARLLYHLRFHACVTPECNHMGAATPLVLEQVAGLTLSFRKSVAGSLLPLPLPLSLFLWFRFKKNKKLFGTICSSAWTSAQLWDLIPEPEKLC